MTALRVRCGISLLGIGQKKFPIYRVKQLTERQYLLGYYPSSVCPKILPSKSSGSKWRPQTQKGFEDLCISSCFLFRDFQNSQPLLRATMLWVISKIKTCLSIHIPSCSLGILLANLFILLQAKHSEIWSLKEFCSSFPLFSLITQHQFLLQRKQLSFTT